MTLDGKIYDYTGGIHDLENQVVKPLPNFDKKIKNDPVLILRFFKMLAKFPEPKFSKKTVETIIENKHLLHTIKYSRYEKEISNIKNSVNAKKTLNYMKKLDIDY